MSAVSACVSHQPEATPCPGIYRRRRPERTVRYQAVPENIETYLSQARWEAPLGGAVPAYVEQYDLRQYLTCGILAHGFACAFCDECGHDFLIAFSCKGRGVCPLCNTRRMGEQGPNVRWTFAALRTPGQGGWRVKERRAPNHGWFGWVKTEGLNAQYREVLGRYPSRARVRNAGASIDADN
jgi:hypothetical protein